MTKQYQVLARKYRPQRFSELVGQEAAIQTLKNALKRGHLAHAYLFSGSRGIGKTTLARLFAKALNCTAMQVDGEPCNQCPSCLDILSGQSLDVLEIDGASNRGIDDIRQINETVAFAPSHGKYKIYIIDEVHMLTKEAFNALLKTLEEPPESAKFFFATTEPHKVLPTILSRCQRFDLGRLSPSQITAKLESIAQDLEREIEAEAIHLLAQHADGSLRDAESLLDQILCFSNASITAADVRNALGLVPQELFFALDKAFAEQKLSFAFELVEELFASGKDITYFLEQLIEHYRHIAVAKTRGVAALGFAPTLASRYADAAALYSQPQSIAILDLLLKADASSPRSASPRIALELTLLQVLRTKNRLPIEALIRRLSEIEEKLTEASLSEAPKQPLEEKISSPQPAEAPKQPLEEKIFSPQPAEEPLSEAPKQPVEEKIELKAVPFSPYSPKPSPQPAEEPIPEKITIAPAPEQPSAPQTPSKHPSHYATLMRFAAVELEGTIKN
ncbi:MAG TPA: DNA polymerase III subunit gamma/tau [Chlamydiales bacterium]|nr:DNA polymerase III subunit gamma/tau [Chlamydiales bacterium]